MQTRVFLDHSSRKIRESKIYLSSYKQEVILNNRILEIYLNPNFRGIDFINNPSIIFLI